MKRHGRALRISAMLGAALLLGACGSMHERHGLVPKGPFVPNAFQADLLRQDRNQNGVPEQLEKVQQIKVCSTALWRHRRRAAEHRAARARRQTRLPDRIAR